MRFRKNRYLHLNYRQNIKCSFRISDCLVCCCNSFSSENVCIHVSLCVRSSCLFVWLAGLEVLLGGGLHKQGATIHTLQICICSISGLVGLQMVQTQARCNNWFWLVNSVIIHRLLQQQDRPLTYIQWCLCKRNISRVDLHISQGTTPALYNPCYLLGCLEVFVTI